MLTRAGKRFFKEIESLAFCIFTVWTQSIFSIFRIIPSGGHGHNLVVKAAGIRSIERESAKQDHSGNGVVRLSNAGTREIVVNEALRSEPAEQPLHHAMLKVKMDNFLIEVAGISKHNRANGRLPSPIPDFLIKPARQAQGVGPLLGGATFLPVRITADGQSPIGADAEPMAPSIIVERPTAGIEIELIGGRRVRFDRDVDPETMKRVVSALEGGAA